MTTTSSSTGTLSSIGLGSGLDANSIITQLVALERKPITQIQTESAKLQTKLSSWGQIQSALAALGDAANALKTTNSSAAWGASTATSSNESAVKVTAANGATAGNYSVSVDQLASAQALASSSFASATSAVGQGTLHIQLGTWNADQSQFDPGSNTAIDVTLGAGDTSLTAIRDKINAAGSTVKASIVTDTTGSRLVLQGATGAANGFRVTATDSDGNNADATGLSALAYDPSAGIGSMSLKQSAANSQATINGLTVTSATNKVTALDGLTFDLGAKTASPINVTVAQDTTTITTAITAFTSAYSKLASLIKTQTAYDASTKTAATLQGDSTARTLQSQLRSLIGNSSSASSTYARLSDVGISIQTDGTLSVDSTKLSAALTSKPDEVRKLFGNVSASSNTDQDGLATRMKALTDQVVGTDGEITSSTAGLQGTIDRNSKRQSELEDRVAAVETRLRAQYTALDASMAQLSSLSTYVTAQLAALSKTA